MTEKTDDFGIYLCIRKHSLFPRMQEKVVVLAVDMQAALSTVKDAVSIQRIDTPPSRIVINKAVLRMFENHARKKKGKKHE